MTTRSTRRITFAGREFLKAGLNVTDNPLLVPPSEMVEARNILVGSTLARKKRGGQTYFSTDDSDENASYPVNPKNNGDVDGPPILGLYEFLRYDSVSGEPKSTLMVRQDDKLWGIDGRTGLATDLTGALILPDEGVITFQTFEGDLYWTSTNPDEGYNVWDGIAAAAVAVSAAGMPADWNGGADPPAVIISHGGRMWAFGVPGFPYRIYYSEFYDAESFATTAFGATGTAAEAGSLDLDPHGDPQGIVGAISLQDRLYAFMRRGYFEISGNTINNFIVRNPNREFGAVAHHTIVPIGNDVMYASERGPIRLSSSDKAIESEAAMASRPIQKIWNKLINRAAQYQFSATYDEEENLYLISVASLNSDENDVVLAYNVEAGVWSGVWEGYRARCLATYIFEGRNRIITGREDGIIGMTNEPSRLDFGEPFTASMRTGILYPGEEIDLQYVWNTATVLASTSGQASLTFNAYVDSRAVCSETVQIQSGEDLLGSSFVLGQSILGSGQFVPQTFPLKDVGYGLQIEVIFNSEADVEVYGFMVDATPVDHQIG